jgi:hypothetical protein
VRGDGLTGRMVLMVSPINGGGHPPRTKEQAVEELTALLCRSGIYVTTGVVTELFDSHWSKLSLLAHAIHDDWKPASRGAAFDAATEAALGVGRQC